MKPYWDIYAVFAFAALIAVLMLGQVKRHVDYRAQCADRWASAECANLGGSLR